MAFYPIPRCTYCVDEYSPTEVQAVPQDPDEPQFCSDSCAEAHSEAVTAYEDARYTGAPVH